MLSYQPSLEWPNCQGSALAVEVAPTLSRARDAVSFEVACAFLPPVLLSVGVGGRRGVQLGAGGAGDAGAGAH